MNQMWGGYEKDPPHTLGPPALTKMKCGADGAAISNSYWLLKIDYSASTTTMSFKISAPSAPQADHGIPGLQLNLVGNLRKQSGGFVGRCPACHEAGQDKGGNHLIIWNDGRFACVCHPGYSGSQHRKRIFAIIGNKQQNHTFAVHIQPSLL